jgi:hypothetical protein
MLSRFTRSASSEYGARGWLAHSSAEATTITEGEGKEIPISDIVSEDGAHELATSANMQPRGNRRRSQPCHWRSVYLASGVALKWGFADFDDVNLETDTATPGPKDLEKVWELLKFRPIQFCLFLKSMVGADHMERMMVEAIAVAKQQST